MMTRRERRDLIEDYGRALRHVHKTVVALEDVTLAIVRAGVDGSFRREAVGLIGQTESLYEAVERARVRLQEVPCDE